MKTRSNILLDENNSVKENITWGMSLIIVNFYIHTQIHRSMLTQLTNFLALEGYAQIDRFHHSWPWTTGEWVGKVVHRLLWVSYHLRKARAKSHILASNTKADIG